MRLPSLIGAILWVAVDASGAPPFSGTIWLDPDIITEADPTAFLSMEDAGRGQRRMYDRRVNGWITENVYLFDARYDDGLSIEVQVNPEFGSVEAARKAAATYAPVIGRIPTCLRLDVETVWLHRGNRPFGGGNNNLLIHTEQADDYVRRGILEETFVHEAAHTSLDAEHARAAGWLTAQDSDGEFISTYARDNPYREDVAETFLLYLALEHRRDRISDTLAQTIETVVPNRVAYFGAQPLDLYPITEAKAPQIQEMRLIPDGWRLSWRARAAKRYALDISADLLTWSELISPLTARGVNAFVDILESQFRLPKSGAYFRLRELPSF